MKEKFKKDDHEMPSECPYCFYENDACTNADIKDGARVPIEGSLSMCIRCGQFSIYNEKLDLQRLTDDDKAAIDAKTRAFMDKLHLAWTMSAKPTMDAKYGKPFTDGPR